MLPGNALRTLAPLLAISLLVACGKKDQGEAPPAEPSQSAETKDDKGMDTPVGKADTKEVPGDEAEGHLLELGYAGMEAARAAAKEAPDCPGAQDGSELVGTPAKAWQLTDWVNSEPLSLEDLRGRVVVVRFWTSPSCPFCKVTLPAIQILAEEFKDQPVTFIGAFHGKPHDEFPDMKEPGAVAKGWGVDFPLAYDREWKTQRSWWLGNGHRHATSETFIIGKDGRIVHVHPGPEFYPSSDAANEKQNRDFLQVQESIRKALKS